MSLSDPSLRPLNPNLPRKAVEELCSALGHDIERVSRITIEPSHVEVVYVHAVQDKPPSFRQIADPWDEALRDSPGCIIDVPHTIGECKTAADLRLDDAHD